MPKLLDIKGYSRRRVNGRIVHVLLTPALYGDEQSAPTGSEAKWSPESV
jgi:hypothetical protein